MRATMNAPFDGPARRQGIYARRLPTGGSLELVTEQGKTVNCVEP
jgi:hypothetical protein